MISLTNNDNLSVSDVDRNATVHSRELKKHRVSLQIDGQNTDTDVDVDDLDFDVDRQSIMVKIQQSVSSLHDCVSCCLRGPFSIPPVMRVCSEGSLLKCVADEVDELQMMQRSQQVIDTQARELVTTRMDSDNACYKQERMDYATAGCMKECRD